jgi:superfamily II DNA/RNA helicase
VHRIGRTGRAGASGLAVSFASGGNDARLVADIEKLIKKKIELEPVEFEEDRPRGRINDGRRHWREEGEAGDARDVLDQPRERSSIGADARRGGGGRPHRAPAAPRDPFFDQPYESGEREAAPAWEAAAKAAPARGISSNIKSKRKVAALFKSAEPS